MLIALAGLSGAGKSTAIKHFEETGVGVGYHAGLILHNEMEDRQLVSTPENESVVRAELRSRFGLAVFAERALPYLLDQFSTRTVFFDAVYSPAEQACLRTNFGKQFILVAVTASFATRCARLATRPGRPLNYEQVFSRDFFEKDRLGIDGVMAAADHRIDNEASLDEFKKALDVFARRIR